MKQAFFGIITMALIGACIYSAISPSGSAQAAVGFGFLALVFATGTLD